MTHDEIRSSIVAEVEALRSTFTAFPVEVEYENRQNVNLAEWAHPFICVEVEIFAGAQLDLSLDPIHLLVGHVVLTSKVKVGHGVKGQSDLLDHFYTGLQKRRIGPARLHMATFDARARTVGGWVGKSALIPFEVHRTYA